MTRSVDKTPKCLLVIYILVFIAVIATVAATSYLPGQEKLLRRLTIESGPYEIASAFTVILLALYATALVSVKSWWHPISPAYRPLGIAMAIAAFLVAGEELSYGQHLLGFSSPELFDEYNLQSETNLHNFVSGRYLTGFLNSSVYSFFIFLPCLYRLRPDLFDRIPRITAFALPLLPSMHVTLMMSFSASLHPYFLATSTTDTLGHICGMTAILIVICVRPQWRTTAHVIHWLAVLLATLFFMLNTHVFRFLNMQAEIREFIVILAGSIWFFEWTQKMRSGDVKPTD
ncbi:MAG: hypothetical protein AAF353_02385 [Pseudomonadota bacterium]